MIQRLQSVLLFLAAAINFPILFLKLGDASSNASMESPSVHLYGMGMEKQYLNELERKFVTESVPLGDMPLLIAHIGIVIGVTILALTAIFLFKNRKLQLKVTYGALVLTMVQLLLAVKLFMDLPAIVQAQDGDPHDFGFALFLPATAILIFLWAARRIQRDEKMVRDMDRIR